ncbi:hypothetical protein E3T37_16515 [Cryobacterium sp. TMT2-10]|uniref:hypothetical protein n=1 Tax=Cryobacterium sp. TMT2-10 TaxID=1259244 RepID=UPI00106CA40C|nr:hypothetical protein [Cryobacterium sp. TMT2-10]TFD34762.1 hypothetical protein E3T37_16515 [Cryobacterium sp. TMT2-10]
MSGDKSKETLVIGGEPRVDLLPLEVRKERTAKVMRRRLALGVVGVLALVIAGSVAATAMSLQAQTQLADEQARTVGLLAEQSKYIKVRNVQDQVTLVEAAQQVGASTEIDWKKYLEDVQATLPQGVTIDAITVDSASPLAIYDQPTLPLQGSRVATVSFTATSAVLPDVPTWLNALATLPGYADALPSSANLDETTKTYKVNITMHINDAAFSKRFATEGK